MLSIATDYHSDDDDSLYSYLERIAEAGFSHVQWNHGLSGDYYYSAEEIRETKKWLVGFNLRMHDLHGSMGHKHVWVSSDENERRGGVEMAKNRINFLYECGGRALIMHAAPEIVGEKEVLEPGATQLRRTLDELRDYAIAREVWVAIENSENLMVIKHFLALYEPEFLGFCYDCGHGNLVGQNGLDVLENNDDMTSRIVSIHLHDNDGDGDLHMPLFAGSLDWERLARVLKASSYDSCVSMETNMKFSGTDDERVFLKRAFDEGTRFSGMMES